MNTQLLPEIDEINTVCVDEVDAFGGEIIDTFQQGSMFFMRAVLPQIRHVRPGDKVQGGIAVRTCGCSILVHPYTFRQVCRNGAIQTQAIQTRRIERVESPDTAFAVPGVLNELGDAIQRCCAPEVFQHSANQMRTAAEADADFALMLLPLLLSSSMWLTSHMRTEILRRFANEGDATPFGLMNAFTSMARDTSDPERRWRLEELGGGIPARLRPVRPSLGPARAKAVRDMVPMH